MPRFGTPRRGKPPWARGPKPGKPPPNPDPRNPHWYMKEYHHSWVDDVLHVALKTDVDAHLTLYWTVHESRMHLKEDTDSGVRWMWNPYFCFVEFDAVEQNEPGDTEWHTFNFAGWSHCQRRWWIVAGEINEVRSPSVSPIMTAHYQTFRKDESMRHTDLTDKNPGDVIDHGDNTITPVKLKYPFAFSQFPTTPAEAPSLDYDVANKKYVDDQPGNGGIWTPIHVEDHLTVEQYSIENVPPFDMLLFRCSFGHLLYGHRIAIQFNDQVGNYYSQLATYCRGTSGPTRSTAANQPWFLWFASTPGSNESSSYKAVLQRMPWGTPGWIAAFHAGHGWNPDSAFETWTGTQVYQRNEAITKITFLTPVGGPTNMRLGVWGASW